MDTHPVLTSHVIHCSQIQKLSLGEKVCRIPRGSRKKEKNVEGWKERRQGDITEHIKRGIHMIGDVRKT